MTEQQYSSKNFLRASRAEVLWVIGLTATNAACKPWRRLDIWRSLTLSSSGLGHRPFTAVTRVRIPLGSHHSLNDLRSRLAKIRTDSTISDVLDVLHERPSTRIEKIPLPQLSFSRACARVMVEKNAQYRELSVVRRLTVLNVTEPC